MQRRKQSYEMNMIEGPIVSKILRFAAPLMLTSILQLFYSATNIVVVGQFAGKEALAAVGSTGPLVNLLINVFIGLSVGASVAVSKAYGAKDDRAIHETVHTAIAIALVGGVVLAGFGFLLAKPLLTLMGTPDDVLTLSALYIQIFFLGMPANLLFNFGSSVLRAVGDTKRPLYFLAISGVVNVALNLLFVIVLNMSVAGVALGTIISQAISAVLVARCLIHSDGPLRLSLKKLKIHKSRIMPIISVGLPAGIQGSLFSISNVLIQSTINSFGSIAMAGSAASQNVEGFVYAAMNAIYQTDITFASQNMGAQQYKRVRQILIRCIFVVSAIGITLGGVCMIFSGPLISIYNRDPEVIRYGMLRLSFIGVPYFLCGIMDVMVGQLRALGYSILPMIVSLTGACALRVVWIYTIFPLNPTLETLFLSYPISWALTASIHILCYLVVVRKLPKENTALPLAENVA